MLRRILPTPIPHTFTLSPVLINFAGVAQNFAKTNDSVAYIKACLFNFYALRNFAYIAQGQRYFAVNSSVRVSVRLPWIITAAMHTFYSLALALHQLTMSHGVSAVAMLNR